MKIRNKMITVRVTDSEKSKLEYAASKCKLPLSEYLRKLGLGKAVELCEIEICTFAEEQKNM